jgi:hypothetical protein
VRYDQVLEEIEPKRRAWNPITLEYEYVGFKGDPTLGYKVCDIDDAGDPAYFGYADVDGNWYIVKNAVASKSFRYASGSSDYATNWTGRAALVYGYIFEAF